MSQLVRRPAAQLYRYVWKVSAKKQLLLTALAITVFLLELIPLELQRRIVNSAVNERGFKNIVVLCLIYVAVALAHGGTKLVLNVCRGSVSEAGNRRLRMQFDPGTRSPAAVKEVASAERGVKVSILVSEVEAVGGFVGSSFCDPVLNAGILLSVIGYMIFVEPWMAAVAFLVFAPQLLFIPFLQRDINVRTKHRIETLRKVSADVIHQPGDADAQRDPRMFRRRIRDIYDLNVQILVRKFGMNFLMNLLYTFGVIGVLAVGGWLMLRGSTEAGTIVAFISGLARMNEPWRDLVNYFRDLTNAALRYQMIVAELDRRDLEPSPSLTSELRNSGGIAFRRS